MNILIGVDGSENSFRAVRVAARLAAAGKDRLALYYSSSGAPLKSSEQTGGEIRDRAGQALAEAVFSKARSHVPEALRADVHTIVDSERPGHGLINAARQWQADMIVVAARGLSPIKSLLLGSVSTTVSRASSVPVLVVRGKAAAIDDPSRVLLGYDAANADRYAAVLGAISWPEDTSGWVMAVIESLLAGPIPSWLEEKARDADSEAMAQAWMHEHEAEAQAKREELARFQMRLPPAFQHTTPIVAEGHPADQILKTIAAKKFNLVVVGKSVDGAFHRMLLGSTSDAVLTHAPCSVLVIPPQEQR